MLLPLTAANFGRGGGFMLRIDRRGDDLLARSAGWVGFYPCAGARNADDEAALSKALGDTAGQAAVHSLRRDAHEQDETCWLHRRGWCLSKRTPLH